MSQLDYYLFIGHVMKNIQLQTLEEFKHFSIALKKEIQTRYSDIKQGFVLECIAKSLDFADWNTMSGVMKQAQEKHSLTELTQELLKNPEIKAGYDKRQKIVKIGHSLRVARENQGMTQAQLANLLGVEEVEVYRLETGQDTESDILQTMIDVGENVEKELLNGLIRKTDDKKTSSFGAWSKKTHIHIDNGGFSLRFHTQKHLLEIESGFYGYSVNTHRFKMTQSLCSQMSVCLNSYMQNPDYNYSPTKFFDTGTSVAFADKVLSLSNDFTELDIPLYQAELVKTLHHFMTQCFEPQAVALLPLSIGLLSSMAMRYDHSFGLMNSERQEQIVKRMERLYSLYAQGLNDTQIENQAQENITTVRQLREEVTGEGFYQPKKMKF